jgi:hypothetical protein
VGRRIICRKIADSGHTGPHLQNLIFMQPKRLNDERPLHISWWHLLDQLIRRIQFLLDFVLVISPSLPLLTALTHFFDRVCFVEQVFQQKIRHLSLIRQPFEQNQDVCPNDFSELWAVCPKIGCSNFFKHSFLSPWLNTYRYVCVLNGWILN